MELLVVLFIMSIIAGLSTVTFGNFNRSAKLNAAAERVSSTLRLAKSYAASSGEEHSFNINTADLRQFWIEDESVLPAGELVDKKYKLPDGVKFKNTTPSTPIVFKPLAGQINFVGIAIEDAKDDSKARTLNVSDDTASRIIIQ